MARVSAEPSSWGSRAYTLDHLFLPCLHSLPSVSSMLVNKNTISSPGFSPGLQTLDFFPSISPWTSPRHSSNLSLGPALSIHPGSGSPSLLAAQATCLGGCLDPAFSLACYDLRGMYAEFMKPPTTPALSDSAVADVRGGSAFAYFRSSHVTLAVSSCTYSSQAFVQ